MEIATAKLDLRWAGEWGDKTEGTGMVEVLYGIKQRSLAAMHQVRSNMGTLKHVDAPSIQRNLLVAC